MKTITFNCEVITPMFLSGADGSTPELRPASIKGAMRFWWRAMHGHLSLDELSARESQLFGGSADGQGRSKVRLRVENLSLGQSSEALPKRMIRTYDKYNINCLDYLAFGISEYNRDAKANILNRSYFKPGGKFSIELIFPQENELELLSAFSLLSEFGGLGAKSRNGFGSFKVISNAELLPQVDLDSKTEASSFSAISKESKNDCGNKVFNTWADALFDLGKSYIEARQKVEAKHTYSIRILLTQPLIVDKKEVRETILKDGRHGKPYFFHVSKNDDGKYFTSIITLPYQFLTGHPKYSKARENDYWKAIEYFNEDFGF
jgi:CRISPR-associated protein Cmr1